MCRRGGHALRAPAPAVVQYSIAEGRQVEEQVTEQKLAHWLGQLEARIPQQVNGVTPAGSEVMASFEYVPGSARIQKATPNEDPAFELYDLEVSYRVRRRAAGEGENPLGMRSEELDGFVCLRAGGDLAVDFGQANFIDGLVQQ